MMVTYDEPLSSFAFNCSLRPYAPGEPFWDYVLEEVRRRAREMEMSMWNPPVITGEVRAAASGLTTDELIARLVNMTILSCIRWGRWKK